MKRYLLPEHADTAFFVIDRIAVDSLSLESRADGALPHLNESGAGLDARFAEPLALGRSVIAGVDLSNRDSEAKRIGCKGAFKFAGVNVSGCLFLARGEGGSVGQLLLRWVGASQAANCENKGRGETHDEWL